jgi:hypothetical protein
MFCLVKLCFICEICYGRSSIIAGDLSGTECCYNYVLPEVSCCYMRISREDPVVIIVDHSLTVGIYLMNVGCFLRNCPLCYLVNCSAVVYFCWYIRWLI